MPDIGYWKNFLAWCTYTSPRQLHVGMVLLAAELLVVLGVFGFLLPLTGTTDNLLEPVMRPRQPSIVSGIDYFLVDAEVNAPLSARLLYILTIVSLAVNGAALGAMLLNWAWLAYRRCNGGSSPGDGHGNSRVAILLFLWVANAAGAAEFVLVNSFLGAPTAGTVADP